MESEREKCPFSPIPTVFDSKAFKNFVRKLALAIYGTKSLNTYIETIQKYWNKSTTGWKREYEPIQRDIVVSIVETAGEDKDLSIDSNFARRSQKEKPKGEDIFVKIK